MRPVRHPRETHRFGAPADWDPEALGPCDTLSVCQTIEDGLPALESHWQIDRADLANLIEGGVLVLRILGGFCPVVSLATEPAPARAPSPQEPPCPASS